MKIFGAILLSICLFVCKFSHAQSATGPKLLNIHEDNLGTDIRKFSSQIRLKQYDSAIVTGKQILKVKPHNAFITYQIGELYEKLGDTVTSVEYYKHALSILDTALDTMNVKNEKYNWVKLNKAIVLILLGQKKAGDTIIQDVYNNETLYSNKQYDLSVLNMTRKELVYGKATNY
jgi:tetratricopeptide (TPR) repeat protein